MKNYKWNTEKSSKENELHIILFTSRNKDNKDVEGFKQRREAFLTTRPVNDPTLLQDFTNFVEKGVDGEESRMYCSVNARDPEKINKALMHYLIDNPETNPAAIKGKLAAIAAQKECAATSRWMFDFDCSDFEKVQQFKLDILTIDEYIKVDIYPTKNNFAVVTNRGFDSRELLKKWAGVAELKKDDLLFMRSSQKIKKA